MLPKILLLIHRILALFKISYFDRLLLPHAVCVVIERPDQKILAVARKDNPNAWGLPGGKVEKDESDWHAATREVQEETGLTIYSWCLREVLRQSDGNGYWVKTYYYCTKLITSNETFDALQQSAKIAWVDWTILTNSVFGAYNLKVFQTLRALNNKPCIFCDRVHP